jgi:hypothetical protein
LNEFGGKSHVGWLPVLQVICYSFVEWRVLVGDFVFKLWFKGGWWVEIDLTRFTKVRIALLRLSARVHAVLRLTTSREARDGLGDCLCEKDED